MSWTNRRMIYGRSHYREVCSVIIYLLSFSYAIGGAVRGRGVLFIKIILKHGKQWKIIGVIIFIASVVPTHLVWLTVEFIMHGRVSHLASSQGITLLVLDMTKFHFLFIIPMLWDVLFYYCNLMYTNLVKGCELRTVII